MPDTLSAPEYILDNFKPSDRVAVLLRNRTSGEVIQRIAPAEKIAAGEFQQWLDERNQAGFDIYIGMNTLKKGTYPEYYARLTVTKAQADISADRERSGPPLDCPTSAANSRT